MSEWASHKPTSCASCTLLNSPGPCWGAGSPSAAKLIYIAQNPGSEEVAATPMTPLIGPSGRIFNRQLTEANIRLDEVFRTNVVKCLTPNNRAPSDHEIRCCKPLVLAELDRCKADTVVLAGDIAMRAFLDGYSTIHPKYKPSGGVFSRMGCVERRAGRKWIATIHPAFIMRMPQFKQAAVDHLRKAWLVSGLPLYEIKINEHPTNSELLTLVDHICLSSREFADDVETAQVFELEEDDYVGGDYHTTMCGVGGRPYEALVADPEQMSLLAPIFRDPTIWRYEHNGTYDQYHIAQVLGEENMLARCWDTMQGTHFLRSFAPKKLKPFTLQQYTLLPYYQGAGSKKDSLASFNMRLYNGMDVITTFLAAKEQRRQMKNWQLEEVFLEFGMPVLPILEDMRRVGVNVDLRKALLFKRVLESRIEKAAELIGKLCGSMFNYNSPKQINELLYVRMKLPTQYNEKVVSGQKTKSVTSDFEARHRLRTWIEAGREEQYKAAYNLLQLLDFISGEEKKLEYIGRISNDGRMHPYYKAHGTSSFRLSSSPNLQNFPIYDINDWGGARRDDFDDIENPIGENKGSGGLGSLRSLIIPDEPSHWILTCDFEQLQLWIYAKQFNVKWLLSIFESREYIYGVVYEKLYKEAYFEAGKPKTKKFKLPNVPEQRIRRAKAVPLGFLFGRQAAAVAKEYGWPLSEANTLRNWWYGLNPELLTSYSTIEYKLRQQGYIRHAFNQVIHYPSGKLTEAINSHAQSGEAFILRGSLIEIARELQQRGLRAQGARIALTTHDSITLNVPEHLLTEVYEEIVSPIMSRPIPQLGNFQFRHSAEVSKMWDWEVTDYYTWKAARATSSSTNQLGTASAHSNPSA